MQTIAQLIVGIVLIFTPAGVWTQCQASPNLMQFQLNPNPVEYDSGTVRAAGETGLPRDTCSGTSLVNCLASSTPIGDGVREPTSLTDLSSTLAWNQDVTITIGLNPATRVRGINLFFYNIPSMGIGFPHEIELMWGNVNTVLATNPLRHAVLGNSDLSQNDSTLRNVTIAALPDNTGSDYTAVSITFRFSDTNRIRWLILSEVEICTEVNYTPRQDSIPVTTQGDELIQLQPDTIWSQINLTCTVEIEGSFEWVWSGPGVDNSQKILADTSRTSSITIPQLSTDSAGMYSCKAVYDPQSLPMDVTSNANGSITFMLRFDTADIVASDPVVVATTNSTVTLSCEIFGYLPRDSQPQITWRTRIGGPGTQVSSDNPLYTISTSDGSRQIQNGGSTPRPSLVSSLTIDVIDESVAGEYVCSGPSSFQTIVLNVQGGSTPPITLTESSRPSEGVGAGNSMLPVIVGAAAGGVVVIILAIIIIVVIVFVVRAKSGLNHYHLGSNGESKDFEMYDGEEPFYQELSKPAPPPLPAHFPSPMGSQIGPYAMVNNVTGNGHFELMEHNFDNRVSVCSEPESNTMPLRLNKQPNFLQNNPLYASADALDRADPPNLPFRREVGSVPPLDYSDSPRGSAFNIYAQPSRVAPPVPNRPPTPTLMGGPIYSEANLSPAVFKQPRRPTASPPEEQMCPYASIYNDPKPLQRSEGPIEVKLHNVKEKRNLGVGQFGQVVLAETVGVSLKDLDLSDTNDDKSVSVLVAVKKLKPDADHFVKDAFEKEIKFMTRLKHENVVQLLGICLEGDAFIVMEYMESGDLNQYLHKSEIAPPGSAPGKNQLHPSTLLYMSMQIANGMKYLASFHFIHRDLATRNCLVGKNHEVKIADFGMSRSLYSSYYYRIRGRAMLPIRWMANECFYGKFSEKTDVWAFGVTMWEIFTFAKKQPYENMTDQEVIDDAIKGPDRQLLMRPEHCPPEVFDVMVGCWVDDPDKRVNFDDVHSSLAAIYDSSSIS